MLPIQPTNIQLAVAKWNSGLDVDGFNYEISIADLAREFNVPKSTLRDNIKRNSTEPPSKGGRPRLVSKTLVNTMVSIARKKDLSKDSFTAVTFKKELHNIRLSDVVESGGNHLSLKMLSDRTLRRVRQEVVPETENASKNQNERRYEALMDTRNHISLAAMWPAVIFDETYEDLTIPPSNMFNFDATTLLLETSIDEKKQLFLAAGSKKELRRRGLNPATTNSREATSLKKRAITIISLTRADGVLSCVIVKVKDSSFSEVNMHELMVDEGVSYLLYVITIPSPKNIKQSVSKKRSITKLKASTTRSSSSSSSSECEQLLEEDVDDEHCEDDFNNDLMEEDLFEDTTSGESLTSIVDRKVADLTMQIVSHSIRHSLKKMVQRQLENDRIGSNSIVLTLSQVSDEPIPKEVIKQQYERERAVVSFDGETNQIRAINSCIDDPRNNKIEWFKLAASCSMTSQPCDKSPSFRIMKAKARSKNGELVPDGTTKNLTYMKQFEEIVKGVDKASRRTFNKFIYYLPEYLSGAFSHDHIKSGWQSSGLYPSDPVRILQYWPNFVDLSEEKINDLLQAVKELTVIGITKGYVDDDDVIKATGHIIPPSAELFNFVEYTFNRWRAAWMNNTGTMERRKQWQDKRDAALVAAEERKLIKAATKAAKKDAKEKKDTKKKMVTK